MNLTKLKQINFRRKFNFANFSLKLFVAIILFTQIIVSKSKYRKSQWRWRRTLVPCAWLERGGFFNIPKYHNSTQPFVQRRHICMGRVKCSAVWLPVGDPNTLTFKLIGTDDMRDYEFQAHFCQSVYEPHHRYCLNTDGEIAFELRQTGTWLMADRVNCRCTGVADVERFSYSKGVQPSDRVFRGNYIHMTCKRKTECDADAFCYVETPSTDGYIYGGHVECICPKQSYCPIYFIRNKRIPQVNNNGRIISYGIKCKKRLY